MSPSQLKNPEFVRRKWYRYVCKLGAYEPTVKIDRNFHAGEWMHIQKRMVQIQSFHFKNGEFAVIGYARQESKKRSNRYHPEYGVYGIPDEQKSKYAKWFHQELMQSGRCYDAALLSKKRAAAEEKLKKLEIEMDTNLSECASQAIHLHSRQTFATKDDRRADLKKRIKDEDGFLLHNLLFTDDQRRRAFKIVRCRNLDRARYSESAIASRLGIKTDSLRKYSQLADTARVFFVVKHKLRKKKEHAPEPQEPARSPR